MSGRRNNPGKIAHPADALHGFIFRSDDNRIAFGIDPHDIDRTPYGRKPLALPDRVAVDAIMLTDGFSGLSQYDRTGPRRFAGPKDNRGIIAVRNKTDLLTLRPLRSSKPEQPRYRARLRLAQPAERQQQTVRMV